MRVNATRRLVPLVLGMALITGLAGAGHASSGTAKAKGEPVVFAMINTENAPAGSFPEMRIAAEAAIEFVNEERGGFGGRPGKLETCITNATAEQSAQCATELVAKNPVAFIGGFDIGGFGSQPIIDASGIPVLGAAALLPPQQTSKTTFGFVGLGSSTLSSLSDYAANGLKADHVNILFPDDIAGRSTMSTTIRPALTKIGITNVRDVGFQASAPDLTPAVTAVTSDNPDAVIVVAATRECPLIMQAAKTIGAKAKLLMVGTCDEAGVLKAAGDNAEGVYFGQDVLNLAGSNKETKLFLKKLNKYKSERVVVSIISAQGFSSVMNTEALLDELGGPNISKDSILTAVRATKDQPNFMAHPYTCDGTAIPSRPAICNGNARVLKVKNGKLVDADKDWINGGSLLS